MFIILFNRLQLLYQLNLFHVEHALKSLFTRDREILYGLNYLRIRRRSTLISAGDIPGIRDACPIVEGR